MALKPGLFPDLTPDEYFDGFTPTPALSNSIMGVMLDQTMAEAKYAHAVLNPDPERRQASKEMRQGDVTHQLALGKGRGYVVLDFPAFTTNAAKEARDAALEAGLTPILKVKFKEAEAMADILKARIRAALKEIGDIRGYPEPKDGWFYQTEVVMAWTEKTPFGTIWMTGMLDVWCEDLMVALDPKITPCLTDKRVRRHMENMGWDRQGVTYERGLSRIFPDMAGRITFADLMVSPKAPHVHRTVRITDGWKATIEPDIERCIIEWGRCLSFDVWPGYEPGIQTLEPTPWKVRAAMEAEMASEEEV